MTAPSLPRPIRRYGNRKLYDAVEKRYVTLEGLGALVAAGHEVEVTDQKTGEDLTSLTLAQVLLEGLKEKTARIPRQVLVRLVRLSAGPGHPSGWADWPSPQEAAGRAREEVEKIVGGLLARGRLSLEEALALRQEVARSVHQIVGEAQHGLEGRLRGLFAAFTPRPAEPEASRSDGKTRPPARRAHPKPRTGPGTRRARRGPRRPDRGE